MSKTDGDVVGARPRARILDELMNHPARPGINAGVDVYANVVIRDSRTKEVVNRFGFQCESFVANFLRMLVSAWRYDDRDSLVLIDGETYPSTDMTVDLVDILNWRCTSTILELWLFQGPMLGVGTTSPVPGDYRLEKQLTHGTGQPDLSAWSGVVGSSSSTITTYGSGASWSNDEWNGYFIRMDSGADLDIEKYILDTIGSTNYIHIYASGLWARKQQWSDAFIGESISILSYGMITHGSVGFTSPTDDGNLTSSFTMTRTFTNATGATIEVSEYGLYMGVRTTDVNYPNKSICIIRDVQTPVSLLDSQEITLTYTFTVVA